MMALQSGGNYLLIKQEILLETARMIVEVVGEDAPFFKSGVTNLLWELRMLLLNAAEEGLQKADVVLLVIKRQDLVHSQ
jgi:hypothetical protein